MKKPLYTITNAITNALTRIERVRGFLEAAQLSEDWIAGMQSRACWYRKALPTAYYTG